MPVKIFFSTFLLTVCLAAYTLAQSSAIPLQTKHERLSFDKGWRFYQGDIPFPVISGHSASYNNAKAGKAWGAAAPTFDDKSWRILNLPHDWASESPFDPKENLSQGYRARGIGWYRRQFKLDASDRGKHLELQFDGIATHCTVWVNGTVVHRNWSGYTSFYLDITALAKYGDELNSIAIRVDAVDQEGWWYEGAGIYRHTWLVKRSPVHIITDGVFAHPIKNSEQVWIIPAEITLENSGIAKADVEIELSVFDKTGKNVSTGTAKASVQALDKTVSNLSLVVNRPELWSVETPTLYTVITRIRQNGKLSDSLISTCGFRTIRFDADSGFFLNEKNVKLHGVCNHQDHAGVGVAVPASIWEFRLRKLKEMGVNAYRCAHNPPSAELLDLCDRMGIMVMDENRNFNSSPEYVRQLEWMVRRDRNHPSIILWSVFNEEPMQGTEAGFEMVRRMSAEVKKLDTSRPVTAAMNGGLFTAINVSQAVDVVGFNYQPGLYDRFHKASPNLPLTSSEDVSGIMVRGEYKTDKQKHTLDSYDTQKPSWGSTHRESWRAIGERPYLAGAFVWTGFDYHGEPTPYGWPTNSSNFGIMDLCGFPKSAFYYYQAQWVDKPALQLIPHWNWKADTIGKPIQVMAMTNAESVKLMLNGKLVSEKPVDKYDMVSWNVPYQPGKLEAIGLKGGKEVSRFKVETTGEPVSLELIPDRTWLAGDGQDAMPITVRALDSKGRPVQTANLPVEFEINRSGTIIGLGNGDPNSHEPEKGNKRSLFNGLAQVIIQSAEGSGLPLEITAKSPGLKSAKITLKINQATAMPFVAIIHPALAVEQWTLSPITTERPDPNAEVAANDMNSWAPTRAGQLQNMQSGKYMILRSRFTPYSMQQEKGGKLVLKAVNGKAEVWLDNKLIASKTTAESADMTIIIPPGSGERVLSVLIEAETGRRAGLGGVVTVGAVE